MENPTTTPQEPAEDTGADSTMEKLKKSAEELKAAATAKSQELRSVAEAKAAEFKELAGEKATELRGKAEAKATELRGVAEAKAGEFREKAGHAYDDAKAKAKVYQSDGERFVRENPMKAVLSALGVGFVLGLIFRR